MNLTEELHLQLNGLPPALQAEVLDFVQFLKQRRTCESVAPTQSNFESAAPAQNVLKLSGEQWLAENRDALDAYNRRITEQGVFSDGLRRF